MIVELIFCWKKYIFDGRKHHINHNLFPPKQLASELKIISENVRNRYLVPEGNHVYNLISIVPHISANQILFHMSIPLLQVDSFKIFRIVSVPSTDRNETWSIRAEHEYLIMSNDRTRYQFLEHSDLQQCATFGADLICWGPYHWNMARVQTCEWNIFNEISNENCTVDVSQDTNVWYNVGENQWLYYSRFGGDLTFVCRDGVFRKQIKGSGLLRFDQNCTVRNFDIEINGKRSLHGRQIDVMIPKIGKYQEKSMKWEHTSVRSNWSTASIDELREAIEVIGNNTFLPTQINQHDVHHYFALYVLMLVFVAFFVYAYFKFDKWKKRLNAPIRSAIVRRFHYRDTFLCQQ